MAKKDFSQVETNRVYNTISELTQEPQELRKPRKSYTAQEALKYMNSLKTSGRKGVALPRINLAFTMDNYDYVQIMSRVSGISMTEFINMCLTQHREAHGEVYEQARAFRAAIDGKAAGTQLADDDSQ